MEKVYDVLVVGGGLVGMATALALESRQSVALLRREAAPRTETDPRVVALAQASLDVLSALGVSSYIAENATPIFSMELFDRDLDDPPTPADLTFDTAAAQGAPLAQVIANRLLEEALERKLKASSVTVLAHDLPFDLEQSPTQVRYGKALTARLLVAADGAQSRLRALAGIDLIAKPYDRCALSVIVEHEQDHCHRAVQYFYASGPFGRLPLEGRRSAVIWTETPAVVDRVLDGQKLDFDALQKRFGYDLGPISQGSGVGCQALHLGLARALGRGRVVLAGDSAHSVHPMAGLGLNFGFRDVAALRATVDRFTGLGLDIGGEVFIKAYSERRGLDTTLNALTIDRLHAAYGLRRPLAAQARRSVMQCLDKAPSVKRLLTRVANYGV